MVDDRALMKKIARGDERAFGEMVAHHSSRLLAVARRLLRSEADAEDAVQRTLLRCYTGAAGYRPEWAVSTWLYRIVTNTCVDEMRRRAARTPRDVEELRRATACPPPPPAAQHIDLERALGRVPREARLLITLHYVDGLSYREMARIRGISVNTVKSQLARGKTILRAALARKKPTRNRTTGGGGRC